MFPSRHDKALARLLLDYGYRVDGNTIIQTRIRGFTSEQIFGHCRDLFDAAEQLIPIIHEKDYQERFLEITKPT